MKSDVEQFQEFSDGVKKGLVDGLREDKPAYTLLVERVRTVDAKAAAFMQFQAPAMQHFMYSGKLFHAFPWSLTPQGADYWMDLFVKMGEHDE